MENQPCGWKEKEDQDQLQALTLAITHRPQGGWERDTLEAGAEEMTSGQW